jgi:hypothetical protein
MIEAMKCNPTPSSPVELAPTHCDKQKNERRSVARWARAACARSVEHGRGLHGEVVVTDHADLNGKTRIDAGREVNQGPQGQ